MTQDKLDALKAEIIAKNICPELAATATQLVMGDGNPDADIVFIGEAPGKNEDEQGLPFVGAAGKFLNEMLAAAGMTRGDVYITNDPWLCAGHLFDLAIVTPVFHQGRVVALMGTVGHVGDIGGSRDALNVTELYEEGLQIPAMKLLREGVENEDLFRLMAEIIRDSDQVLGDVRSFISANATGVVRMPALK